MDVDSQKSNYEAYLVDGKSREFLTSFIKSMPSPEMVLGMGDKQVRKALCEICRLGRLQTCLLEENERVLKIMRDMRETEQSLIQNLLESLLKMVKSKNAASDMKLIVSFGQFFQQNESLKAKYDALMAKAQQADGNLSPTMLSPNGAIGTAALPIPSSLNLKSVLCPPPPPLPHMMCFPPPSVMKKPPFSASQVLCPPIGVFPDFSLPPPPILKPNSDHLVITPSERSKSFVKKFPLVPFSVSSVSETSSVLAASAVENPKPAYTKISPFNRLPPKRVSPYFTRQNNYFHSRCTSFRGAKVPRIIRMQAYSSGRKGFSGGR